MQTTSLTPEHKRMNRYWWLLAGTLNELLMVLDTNDLSDTERLAKIRAIHDFSREKMGRTIPPSVIAENQERTDYEGEPEPTDRERDLEAQGKRLSYIVDEHGVFHEHVYTPDPNEGPLTDEEVEIMLREGWGSNTDG